MTRHPAARRVHRPAADADDAFVAGVLESSAWAREHSRPLIVGGVIAAVAIIVTIFIVVSNRQNEERSSIQLTQVRAVAMSGNAELAIRDIEQFINQYSGTAAANEARLLLAAAYLDAGQQQKAVEAVRNLADDVDTDVGVNAAMLTAAAHESAGQSREAETALMRIADDGRFLYQRQDALDHVARLRMQRGDVAGALQMYERLLALTPENAAERQVYELRLGEVQALAASGGAAPAQPPAATTGG